VNIGNAGAQALSVGLRTNATLKKISMRGGNLTDEGIDVICRSALNGTLASLNLQNNRYAFSARVLQSFSALLSTPNGLKELILSNGVASEEFLLSLFECLMENQSLVTLQLGQVRNMFIYLRIALIVLYCFI
jgi:hypothetical protein